MAASSVMSIYILLRRHEVNDLLLLCNRNSILNKMIERKRIKRTTVISMEFIFLHEETRYTRDDTTYFDVVQLLSGGMLCMLSARKRKAECAYSFTYRTFYAQKYIIYAIIFNPYA